MKCLVRLIRSTKFLDRQCVRCSLKVSEGMLKTNYESNACLLLETDLRWSAVEIRPPRLGARTKIRALAAPVADTQQEVNVTAKSQLIQETRIK